ncbi:MAG: PRC-barrel domain-containing protein [Oleiphilaceae bacterium]|nr:PRC-barrel domain-containing protein [Oleiphilaceae bacterium]
MKLLVWVVALTVIGVSGCAQMGDKPDVQKKLGEDVATVGQEVYSNGYDDFDLRAVALLRSKVLDSEGKEVGTVEDLLINEKNRIVAVVAEVGGFLDIGDTHLTIPWDDVIVRDDRIRMPVSEDNVEQFRLRKEHSRISESELTRTLRLKEGAETGSRLWRVTSLGGAYASFEDEAGYGYVRDVLFSDDGEVKAIVIQSGGDYFFKSYPFYGITINPTR